MTEVQVEVMTSSYNATLSTQCISCNMSNLNASLNGTLTESSDSSAYTLSGYQIIQALNPQLHSVATYFYIIWYVIGLPTNLIAFLVWIQQQMINSSGCYIAALALTDCVLLLLHGIIMSATKWWKTGSVLNYPILCQLLPMLYMTAQYMSTLLVFDFTMEQYIAICHPFKRSHYCRVSIAKKIIIGVLVISLALSSPQAYFFILEKIEDDTYCMLRPSVLEGGIRSPWTVWTFVSETLLFGAVPMICLLLNIRVIYAVINQGKVQITRNYSVTRPASMRRSARGHGTTTVMLLAVSLYWVCTEIPATIALGVKQAYEVPPIQHIEEAEGNEAIQKYMVYMTARTIIEVVSFSRYSCKFFVYLATGRQFRRNLKRLLCWSKRQIPSRNTSVSGNIATNKELEEVKLLSANNNNNNGLLHTQQVQGKKSKSKQRSQKWHEDPTTECTTLQDEDESEVFK